MNMVFSILLWSAGTGLIVYFSGWPVFCGIFLLLWANNYEAKQDE